MRVQSSCGLIGWPRTVDSVGSGSVGLKRRIVCVARSAGFVSVNENRDLTLKYKRKVKRIKQF